MTAMTSSKPTIVIVPGAWHAAAAYDKLARGLESVGFDTLTIELASIGVRDPPVLTHRADVDEIHKALGKLVNQEGKQVILLAHSYGGHPASDAVKGFESGSGRQGGVRGVIFLASFLAEASESLLELCNPSLDRDAPLPVPPGPGPDGQMPVMKSEDGLEYKLLADNLAYTEAYNPNYWLFNGIPEEVATQCMKELKPHAGLCYASKTESVAWHHVPCTFIGRAQDRPVGPELQQRMLSRVKPDSKFPWTVSSIDYGHSPFAVDDGVDNLKAAVQGHVTFILAQQG